MPVVIGSRRTRAVLALIALGATACRGRSADSSAPPSTAPPPTSTTAPRASAPPSTLTVAATIPDVVATVPPTTSVSPTTTIAEPIAAPVAMRAVSLVDRLVVFDQPAGAEVVEVPATTAFGTPSVLGVDTGAGAASVPGWTHVLLPMRPNGSSGWVRAGDVRLEPVAGEIHIDLAARTLRFVEHGAVVGEWLVTIGTPDRPTPTGRFFVTDKLDTGDPDSVWGRVAVGISAFSGVLTDFIGGVGQIGVHGTNNPDSIGRAASSGCIRLPNEVIEALIGRIPLGTPVLIT